MRICNAGLSAEAGLLAISRGTAVLLLGVYFAYIFFQVSPHLSRTRIRLIQRIPKLKTHPHYFESQRRRNDEEEEQQKMSIVASAIASVPLFS